MATTENLQIPFKGVLQAVIRGKGKAGKRWTDYEEFIIDHMKELQGNEKWKYQGKKLEFPGSSHLEHRPTFWARWINKAEFYNHQWAQGAGFLKWKEFKAFIPETEQHINAIDKWPTDDPPLTGQAVKQMKEGDEFENWLNEPHEKKARDLFGDNPLAQDLIAEESINANRCLDFKSWSGW